MPSQLTGPRLFKSWSSEKVYFLLCNNISQSPVPFMQKNYIPLIICSREVLKKEANRKHKLPSHSTRNLKSKKPCGQSFIKALLHKGLPRIKVRLNMTFCEKKIAVVRSFRSSLIVSPKLLFLYERSKNVKKSFFNFNLEVSISCSEKSNYDRVLSLEFWIAFLQPCNAKWKKKKFQ